MKRAFRRAVRHFSALRRVEFYFIFFVFREISINPHDWVAIVDRIGYGILMKAATASHVRAGVGVLSRLGASITTLSSESLIKTIPNGQN